MSATGTTVTPANVLAQLQLQQQIIALQIASVANPIVDADTAAQFQKDADICAILIAALTAYVPAPAPAPAPVPAASTDIITTQDKVYISDTISRNITGNGSTQVYHTWKYANAWVELPRLADGGDPWQDQHADGQTLTLRGCIPGILQGMPNA